MTPAEEILTVTCLILHQFKLVDARIASAVSSDELQTSADFIGASGLGWAASANKGQVLIAGNLTKEERGLLRSREVAPLMAVLDKLAQSSSGTVPAWSGRQPVNIDSTLTKSKTGSHGIIRICAPVDGKSVSTTPVGCAPQIKLLQHFASYCLSVSG